MKPTRQKILETLIENVPASHPFVGIPFLVMPIDPITGYESENTLLIDDLELDSIDINSMICGTCEDLGIDASSFGLYNDEFDGLNTLGDCVDLIEGIISK